MNEQKVYSSKNVFEELKRTFHQYLEAQYHVWDDGLIQERRRLLAASGTSFTDPRLEVTPSYKTAQTFNQLSLPAPVREVLSLAASQAGSGIPSSPYQHQYEAIKAVLDDEEIIVASGTGSGKTESFLMPILGLLSTESHERSESWKLPGMRALLLYPMNALVNDQLARLRRLLGNSQIASFLRGQRGANATFGMYTSRTPYPGSSTPAKNRERIGELLEKLFEGLSDTAKAELQREGKWPAKNLDDYLRTGFLTSSFDSELYSRQEMQKRSPDLIVTNYSMLEYMLLRPIERSIFDQTAEWLKSDSENRLTIVLDEAHMYRGSSGAEVAYLLRRLHSRLDISRERVRYILTSASLGTGDKATEKVKQFAGDLTGLAQGMKSFKLIRGTQILRQGPRKATSVEQTALSSFDIGAIHTFDGAKGSAEAAVRRLFKKLSFEIYPDPMTLEEIRNCVDSWIKQFGPASLAANRMTETPERLQILAEDIFPEAADAEKAMESLLALMSFAKNSKSGQVYAPVRSHLFFRGLPGLFACVNPRCNSTLGDSQLTTLGKLFAAPQLRCSCGARVYELLTHRDCGAAFIRGYLGDSHGDFLWHQRSTGLWEDLILLESHFLVEVARQSRRREGQLSGFRTWLHITTGRLVADEPSPEIANEYIALLRPEHPIRDQGKVILSFDRECPVCLRAWQGRSKIMDLATKGEAPFAHLVRQQVALQPPTRSRTIRSPNQGRKSLLFSDGRQKAARLARDIPREIEQDVFRQLLLMAVQRLVQASREPSLGRAIYIGFLDVLNATKLQLFDGDDLRTINGHVTRYERRYGSDLEEALTGFEEIAPARFHAQLLRQLGSRFYSISALTLAYVVPCKGALKRISSKLTNLSSEEISSLAIIFIQNYLNDFAYDKDLRLGIRQEAAGYRLTSTNGVGFSRRQRDYLTEKIGNVGEVESCFAEELCSQDPQDRSHISPGQVKVHMDLKQPWHQCMTCTSVAPILWWGNCPNCLSPDVNSVQPENSSYLRARKGFWRDPVVAVLDGQTAPLNLIVEEHTAQLSYRDSSDPTTTTEEFERRFRDILTRPDDVSVDVLSSTTTMEVGIDIGSLVAVGLRNIPPLRQNYQQRAGRAGRRGSSISTVVTYAQNSPHDNHYFQNPEKIISGEPTMPGVDTNNPKIVERHIRAQIVQTFFRDKGGDSAGGDIFSMLGETWAFFSSDGEFSLNALEKWIRSTQEARECYERIRVWIPERLMIDPAAVAERFIAGLQEDCPAEEEHIDQSDEFLIEFLFSHGYLPAYAFPRDLCALQIEGQPARGGRPKVPIIQRPQQGLNIALSEYAPGRLVVVNKKTYRIGSICAAGMSTIVNRAERLFEGSRNYIHCDRCSFTTGFGHDSISSKSCPICRRGNLRAVPVIQPEVVFPEDKQEVDEFDDDQTFSQTTSAQLPIPEDESSFFWKAIAAKGQLTVARNQPMVMVNRGESPDTEDDGFMVCEKCGKTSLDGNPLGLHNRDYHVLRKTGEEVPPRCNGEAQRVYLGYSFSSDILLLRIPLDSPLYYEPTDRRADRPMSAALQSLCEALVLGISRELDIDAREINAGFRFTRREDSFSADLFVFDTLSGGAGYATLAGAVLEDVLKNVQSTLEDCDCATSCDKCLRNYANRAHHDDLNRWLALDLLRYISSATPPAAYSLEEQRVALTPLKDLLQLAGWAVNEAGATPFQALRGGNSVDLWAIPTLVDCAALGLERRRGRLAFSPYELEKDLPGAYACVVAE